MAADTGSAPTMDGENLFREEVFTDRRVGTIRRLMPVDTDGNLDASRQPLYIGEAQLYTPAGALPLQFELEGSTLSEAVASFEPAASKAVDSAMEQLKELRREAASSIVVPGSGSGMAGGAGPGPGGGIQIP